MTSTPDVTSQAQPDEMVRRLRDTMESVLTSALPAGSDVALVGYPNHSNVGDSAIWKGELAYLRERGHDVAYACDWLSYRKGHLEARSPDGAILLHGGGNLGDIWPEHQRLRERVIQDFPRRKIVQLPQTLHFSDRGNFDAARAVFNSHRDLTLLARDRASLELARTAFSCRSELCPDMAFALGSLPRHRAASSDILWLGRTDAESAAPDDGTGRAAITPVDWLSDQRGDLGWRPLHGSLRRACGWLSVAAGRLGRPSGLVERPLYALYDRLVDDRVAYGCELLTRGRVVVTDRLHGHILSVLLGLPHVLLDNSYGKNRTFYETWSRGSPLTRWADSQEDALQLASELLRERAERSPT
jgi:pyruvyl transferase EpsO